MVFGPDVGDQSSLAEDSGQHGSVQRLSPNPMAGNLAISHRQIPVEDQLGDKVKEQRVEKSVQNPGPEAVLLEEDTLLAQLV